jgi:SPP1 family holin
MGVAMVREKIDIPSITRTGVLLLALVNQALTAANKSPLPFSEDSINEFITYSFTVGASLWAWWKNNNFTAEALEADAKLKELKLQKVTRNNRSVVSNQPLANETKILLSIQVVPQEQGSSEETEVKSNA